MDQFGSILLVHILAGSIALLAGTIALCLKKGSPRHRLVGKGFVYSMLVMGITGILLALLLRHALFTIIGLFALYLVGSGWRAARRPAMIASTPEKISLTASSLITFASITVGVFGLIRATPISETPAILYLLFGFDGIIFLILDTRILKRGRLKGNQQIVDHLWRMIMALIFAATALFVTNVQVLPHFLPQPYFSWGPVLVLYLTLGFWIARFVFFRSAHATSD